MGFFDRLKGRGSSGKPGRSSYGFAPGPNKADGGHNHTYNKGNDRTPAQRKGDEARRKKGSD